MVVTWRSAECRPALVGVKVTLNVADAPGARLAGVLPWFVTVKCEESSPATAESSTTLTPAAPSEILPEPVFVTLTVCAGVCPLPEIPLYTRMDDPAETERSWRCSSASVHTRPTLAAADATRLFFNSTRERSLRFRTQNTTGSSRGFRPKRCDHRAVNKFLPTPFWTAPNVKWHTLPANAPVLRYSLFIPIKSASEGSSARFCVNRLCKLCMLRVLS